MTGYGIGPTCDDQRRAPLLERREVALGLLGRAGVEDDHRRERHARAVGRVRERRRTTVRSSEQPSPPRRGRSAASRGPASIGWAIRPPVTICSSVQPVRRATPRRRSCRRRRAAPRRGRDATRRSRRGPRRRRSRARRRRRLSAARPCFAISQPSPPPSVSPAIPVVEIAPPVVARPCSAVAAR